MVPTTKAAGNCCAQWWRWRRLPGKPCICTISAPNAPTPVWQRRILLPSRPWRRCAAQKCRGWKSNPGKSFSGLIRCAAASSISPSAPPVAVACGAKLRMNISGGTDVRAAPPLDYFRYVLLPLLSSIGVRAKIDLLRRGYFPRGGGEVAVTVESSLPLRPLLLEAAGNLLEIRGHAHIANLPAHIVQRMAHAALAKLAAFPSAAIDQTVLGRGAAIGAGGAIVLAAQMQHTRLGAATTAQRGVPAEQLGSEAGRLLREEILSGATLDIHAADQVLIYLALAGGSSRFLARSLSSHAATTIWLLEQFLPVRFGVSQAGHLVRIKMESNMPHT